MSEIDLENRTLEIIIKVHLPKEIQTNDDKGVRGLYESACKQVYDAAQVFQTLFGTVETSVEVKARPKNPCPRHPFDETEACPKCQKTK